MSIRLLSSICFVLLATLFLNGHWKKYSEVKTEIQKSDESLTIRFKVVPVKNKEVTDEGPWKLTIKNPENLDLKLNEKGQWEMDTYDKSLPGFVFTGKPQPGKASGKFDYKLRAFVCNKDKTQCYPQEHRGSVSW